MTSRLKNSVRNSFWGALSNIIITLLNFFVRTIFIKTLGNEYLGINGLFTNILYILSFAELGVGHAITYCMYKPVANNDYKKTKSLLKLYKKYYNIIGIIIFIAGILIIPFFPFIIKDAPNIKESLIVIYLLYLFETASSYFLSYKKSIIMVNQKDYICDIVKLILFVIKSIVQVIVLLLTKNYILYLSIFVLSTFLINVILSIIANKKYPFIKDKDVEELDKKEKKDITNNIKSLILYKIGRVSLSGTDNIIISSLIGISVVGFYSNYSLIISAVSGITYLLLKGSTSSIGNVNATESTEKKEDLMQKTLFVSTWLYGFTTICLAVLLSPFIEIWIGKEYLLETSAVLSSVFYILVDGLEFPSHTYISTLGYFRQTRFSSLICAILNIVLSIVLGMKFGLFGIFISTSISKILTTSWFDTYVLYKYEFKKSPRNYYIKHIVLLICVCLNFSICYYVTSFIQNGKFSLFIIKTIITVILSNTIFILMFYKTNEFKYMKKIIGGVIPWKKKKLN